MFDLTKTLTCLLLSTLSSTLAQSKSPLPYTFFLKEPSVLVDERNIYGITGDTQPDQLLVIDRKTFQVNRYPQISGWISRAFGGVVGLSQNRQKAVLFKGGKFTPVIDFGRPMDELRLYQLENRQWVAVATQNSYVRSGCSVVVFLDQQKIMWKKDLCKQGLPPVTWLAFKSNELMIHFNEMHQLLTIYRLKDGKEIDSYAGVSTYDPIKEGNVVDPPSKQIQAWDKVPPLEIPRLWTSDCHIQDINASLDNQNAENSGGNHTLKVITVMRLSEIITCKEFKVIASSFLVYSDQHAANNRKSNFEQITILENK